MWTITEGEDGFLISEVNGHMSEPWGLVFAQQKAIKLIEFLEWGEALEKGQVSLLPPKKPIKRGRRKS